MRHKARKHISWTGRAQTGGGDGRFGEGEGAKNDRKDIPWNAEDTTLTAIILGSCSLSAIWLISWNAFNSARSELFSCRTQLFTISN